VEARKVQEKELEDMQAIISSSSSTLLDSSARMASPSYYASLYKGERCQKSTSAWDVVCAGECHRGAGPAAEADGS